MQEWYLGWEKVSCLERCPQFRSVLIERERFHCIYENESDLDSLSPSLSLSVSPGQWVSAASYGGIR